METEGSPRPGAIHEVAARGFEAAAGAYERGRPSYPEEAVGRLALLLQLGPGRRVLDAGAGTGKLTRLLLPTGAEVIALEPIHALRLELRRALGRAGKVLAGLAERIPLRPGSLDGIAAAQAFHWFRGPAALAEFARVLRPHGSLALLWNVRDESVEWVARLGQILNRSRGSVPRHGSGEWRGAFRGSPFEEPRLDLYRHVERMPPEAVVDRAASVSHVAALPPDARAEVLEEVRALLRSHPETAGRREIELPYSTEIHHSARR